MNSLSDKYKTTELLHWGAYRVFTTYGLFIDIYCAKRNGSHVHIPDSNPIVYDLIEPRQTVEMVLNRTSVTCMVPRDVHGVLTYRYNDYTQPNRKWYTGYF